MSQIYSSELRIPKERVAVVIGKNGSTKRKLERKTQTRIKISKEGDILISGEDNLDIYLTTTILKAIGRGFNPEIAQLLFDERYAMEILPIDDASKKSLKNRRRITSRLIGKEGKARYMLETLTGAHISIYGKTVAILGEVADVMIARHAVEKLLQGAPHGNAYKYIESQKKTQHL